MAESAVWFALEDLASLLKKEVVSICGLHDKVEMVQRKLKRIQCFLKGADGRSEEDDFECRVNEIRQVAYEIEDVIDRFVAEVESYYNQRDWKDIAKRIPGKLTEIIKRWNINNRIDNIMKRIDEINQTMEQLGNIDEGEDPRKMALLEMRRRDACEDRQNDVVGLGDKINRLVNRLVEGEARLCVISVVGQAGIGKTVLARKVYNQVKSSFRPFAWIHVSSHSSKDVLRDLCRDVLHLPRHETEKLNEGEMREKIEGKLKGKKYFVVLDDVWTTKTWDDVRGAFPGGRSGSRVLMTTQHRGVAKHADARTIPYELPLPNHEDSYKLLLRNAFPATSSDHSCSHQEFKRLADDIVERCGRLPLALVAVGRILSETKQTDEAWQYFVDGFKWDLTHGDNNISGILKLSLDYLHYDLKLCLLYCCAFPKDSEIRVKRLLSLWIAEGFVKKQEDRTPEAVSMHYLNELIDRNLIQPCKRNSIGEIKTCRVHDVLHVTLAAKAGDQNFLQIHQPSTNCDLLKSRRLAVHSRLEQKRGSFLARTFLAFEESEPQTWCEQIRNFELLRVLDLEGVRSVATLPKEIGNLVLLRYLGLRHTSIKTLPKSTKKLHSLQTLDLRTFANFCFPQSIMSSYLKAKHVRKMANLRHLYFGNRRKENFNVMEVPDDFGVKVVLKELQTLQYVKAGRWVEKGLSSMTNLRKLGIQVPDAYTRGTTEVIAKLRHLHSLYLHGRLKDLPNKVFEKLTKLTLHFTDISEPAFLELQPLKSMKNLKLIDNAYSGRRMICKEGKFPLLEVLNLENLECLEEMVIEPGAFPELKYMRIASCNKLDKIPEGLETVNSLQELRLVDMGGRIVERVQSDQGADRQRIMHIQLLIVTTSTVESEIDLN